MVRIASAADRQAVVRTTVAAFERDPALRHFFPDDDYPRQASHFFGYLFDKRVEHGTVWVTDDCEAAALWSPPTESADDLRRANELHDEMLFEIGMESATRLIAYNSIVDEHLPSDPIWYLGVLAVHPDHAGRRLGAKVMQAGVDHVHTAGGVAVLETTQPANVAYYQRQGWTLTAQITTHQLPIWLLRNSEAFSGAC